MEWPLVSLSSAQKNGFIPPAHSLSGAIAMPSLLMFGLLVGAKILERIVAPNVGITYLAQMDSFEQWKPEAAAESAAAAPVLLSVVGLSKRFAAVTVLDALDLELRAGEVVGLLGPNGAGKTTTLKLLLGLLKPSAGSAAILGFDCTHDSQRVKERIGFTPDEPQFYDFLSGKETLDFVISARGLEPKAAWASLAETIEILDFSGQLAGLTSSYSHGMKKKLALLCALVHQPRVLLLDEPTNGLDPPTALRVRALLRRQAAAGATVLLSTHLLEMAERMCDRLLVIDHGRMIGAGTASELRAQAGVAADASLEQAFLRLVGV